MERNEDFNLIINPKSLRNGVTSGIHEMTAVVIVNDDSKLMIILNTISFFPS